MLPELGQNAVTTLPFRSLTSAMNRLYLLMSTPWTSLGQAKPLAGPFLFIIPSMPVRDGKTTCLRIGNGPRISLPKMV